MMKRTILFLSFLLLMILQLSAEGTRRPITLEHKGGPRDGSPLCFDMPLAYYYYNSKTHDIIIDGGGVVSYYDVEISSPVTNTVEMSIQVDGTYDTFDISSLPAGAHVIICKALHL